MAWLKKIARQHDCIGLGGVPSPLEAYGYGADFGSVYSCDLDDCNRLWKLSDTGIGSFASGHYIWVELTGEQVTQLQRQLQTDWQEADRKFRL